MSALQTIERVHEKRYSNPIIKESEGKLSNTNAAIIGVDAINSLSASLFPMLTVRYFPRIIMFY